MDKLLSVILDAHGGLERWSRTRRLNLRATVGGPFWAYKGQPDLLAEELVEMDTRVPRIRLVRTDTGRVIDYDGVARRVSVRVGDGAIVAERDDPRSSMLAFDRTSRWDATQAAYFVSYAAWHYFAEPFLFTFPGVVAEEIDPFTEERQTWRRLRVTFPDSLATHSRVQTYFFDGAGMQRRMDYEPVVNGGALVAHYTDEERSFDGLVFPTRRRVHPRRDDGSADRAKTVITLDLHDVRRD